MTSPLAIIIAALAAGILTTACVLDRAPPAPSSATSPTAIPTFTPTPRPLDSMAPSPTPTTNLSRSRAEFLVWNMVSACANEVASSTQIKIEVAFSSEFDSSSGEWIIQATSGALDLNLGLWKVSDEAGEVSAQDDVAADIASGGYVCRQPQALLSDALTPPSFATPTPVPTPTPIVAVESAPTPTPEVVPTPTPAVATGTQAEVRVWLAVRDCFTPPPEPERFRAYQDRADRWIVEGRLEPDQTDREDESETVFYGVWLLDRDTGRISPHDNLAKQTQQNRTCYVEP